MLIPPERRQTVHLEVGLLLLGVHSAAPTTVDLADIPFEIADLNERIFDIVGHLNAGSMLLTNQPDRTTLATLNLAAGHAWANMLASNLPISACACLRCLIVVVSLP